MISAFFVFIFIQNVTYKLDFIFLSFGIPSGLGEGFFRTSDIGFSLRPARKWRNPPPTRFYDLVGPTIQLLNRSWSHFLAFNAKKSRLVTNFGYLFVLGLNKIKNECQNKGNKKNIDFYQGHFSILYLEKKTPVRSSELFHIFCFSSFSVFSYQSG